MPRLLKPICPNCGETREVVSYIANGVSRIRSICRPCHSKQSYESRKKRRSGYLEQLRNKAQTDINRRAYLLWRRAKDRASKRGLSFSITRDQIETWLNNGICQVTGLKFDLRFDNDKMNPLAPSLDRIDPKNGYVDGNVQMVCWVYNRAKGDGSADDVLLLVEAMNAIKIRKAA
jgi:hypothetical protein